ncbi:MAG: copper chaperone PCu(A)C [Steroidobacteraceae bacterium]
MPQLSGSRMGSMSRTLCALAMLCLGTVAVAAQTLHVMQPTASATPPTATTAAVYLMVHNAGASSDRLIGASTPIADKVEIHTVEMKGDVMQMRPVDGLDLAVGGMIEFATGKQHLMLVGLKQPLKAGDKFELTLKFAKAGELKVNVPVTALGGAMKMPGMSMPGMQH